MLSYHDRDFLLRVAALPKDKRPGKIAATAEAALLREVQTISEHAAQLDAVGDTLGVLGLRESLPEFESRISRAEARAREKVQLRAEAQKPKSKRGGRRR